MNNRKNKLMGEKELMQSVSAQRLDVLNSLHNAPTLKAIKSDAALYQSTRLRKLQSSRSMRSHHSNNQHASNAHASVTASEALLQKLDVLEDLFTPKNLSPQKSTATPKRVTVVL